MSQEAIIQKTIRTLHLLPVEKAAEVADFADYVLKRYEEHILKSGTARLAEQSEVFRFLEDEEELYSVNDIKEKY